MARNDCYLIFIVFMIFMFLHVCGGVDVHCFHNPVTLWSEVHNY